jgi:hypothetical protein
MSSVATNLGLPVASTTLVMFIQHRFKSSLSTDEHVESETISKEDFYVAAASHKHPDPSAQQPSSHDAGLRRDSSGAAAP